MSVADEIVAGYGSLQAGQEAFYQDLHEHPELSHQEHRTAGKVAGQLADYGFTVQTGIGGTGVVGVLANGDGPAVLLRAELDALPQSYLKAEQEGRLQDLPSNHSPKFLPPLQPTLRTGTGALATAALAWLAP